MESEAHPGFVKNARRDRLPTRDPPHAAQVVGRRALASQSRSLPALASQSRSLPPVWDQQPALLGAVPNPVDGLRRCLENARSRLEDRHMDRVRGPTGRKRPGCKPQVSYLAHRRVGRAVPRIAVRAAVARALLLTDHHKPLPTSVSAADLLSCSRLSTSCLQERFHMNSISAPA